MYKNILLNGIVKMQFNEIRKKYKNVVDFNVDGNYAMLIMNENGFHILERIYDEENHLYLNGVKLVNDFEQICYTIRRNEDIITELDSFEANKLKEENVKLYEKIGGTEMVPFAFYFLLLTKYYENCI